MTETLKSVGIDIGTSAPRAAGQPAGTPMDRNILGASELPLRKISALLRFYALTSAPLCGAPVVEVPR